MPDILRIGVAGLGATGRAHIARINHMLRGGNVTAVTDANIEYGMRAAEELGLPFFDSSHAMIASGGIDALLVAAADTDHEAPLLTAIKAGLPVFCEEPLVHDPESCLRVIYAETAGGRRLVQLGFMRRYDPGYRQLKSMVDSGHYGNPLLVHCAQRYPSVGKSFTTPMTVSKALIHEIDALRWLIGEEYHTVETIIPRSTRNTHPGLRDPQMLLLTSRSGVWMDAECFLNCRAGCDVQCEVVFEDGIARLPEPSSVSRLVDGTRATPVCSDWSERFAEAYNTELQEWMDNCLAGRVEGPGAWDGYAACIAVEAAQQSREVRRPVEVHLPECPALYRVSDEDKGGQQYRRKWRDRRQEPS